MSLPEDTKPRSPFDTPPSTRKVTLIDPMADEAAPRRGAGCLLPGVIGAGGLLIALVIVLLSGAAGWTSGQRTAQQNATATQSARVGEQLNLIPNDLDSGNTVMLRARVEYLATLGVPNAGELAVTATALYLSVQPTVTPTVEATALPTQAVEVTQAATAEPTIVIETTNGEFDLAALLQEARTAVTQAQYQDAIDLLDAIIRIDPNYEATAVRSLMLEALSTRALNLFRTGNRLAEAVLLVDRAEQFGLPGQSELRFERDVATLYLTAAGAVGTNYNVAISALRQVIQLAGPNYLDTSQLLFGQYVAYGDALVAGGDYCSGASQYQNALTIFADGGVSAKRDSAQMICEQGTPVGTPGIGVDGTPLAPIGVPGT